ncbi:SH2 domain-containing protein 6 isoform X3 [Sminthopsis crassicaudata]|uniref:SH2 domain-containing protein 6 isoform X3 n=1 Tax=Sminthopsis crassicaudata TaxID=9301 RepID=UPI003D6867FD
MQISGTMGSLFALILPALKRSGCGSGSHWLLSPLMDKIGGNRTPSQAPLPPPRAPGKLPRGAARAAPQSWREDALTPSSPAAPGPLGQWVTSSDSYSAPSLALGPDLGPPPVPPLPPAFRPPGSRGLSLQDREEEEDGEGEYELPPCESLAARMAPFLGEKSALYLDRSVTSGPPKPVPRASRLLRAPSLQEAGGRGDRLGRRGLAAAGSSDPAEEDSEEAIYLEPTLVSPLNQDLGPQAPSPPAVIPRATMAPRSAYKALSVSQEAWSGSGDIAHNGGRSAFTGNPAAEEKAALLTQPWYSAHCDRQTAENALLSLQKVRLENPNSSVPLNFTGNPWARGPGAGTAGPGEGRKGSPGASGPAPPPTGRLLHGPAQLRPPGTAALHAGRVLPRPRLQHPHPVAGGPATVRARAGEQEL